MLDRKDDILLRAPEVIRRTGLSVPTIYRKMKAGEFPDRIRLSANIVAWYASDIAAWIDDPLRWGSTTSDFNSGDDFNSDGDF